MWGCVSVFVQRSEIRELVNVLGGLLKKKIQHTHRWRFIIKDRLLKASFLSFRRKTGERTEDSFLIPCLKQKKEATQYRTQ